MSPSNTKTLQKIDMERGVWAGLSGEEIKDSIFGAKTSFYTAQSMVSQQEIASALCASTMGSLEAAMRHQGPLRAPKLTFLIAVDEQDSLMVKCKNLLLSEKYLKNEKYCTTKLGGGLPLNVIVCDKNTGKILSGTGNSNKNFGDLYNDFAGLNSPLQGVDVLIPCFVGAYNGDLLSDYASDSLKIICGPGKHDPSQVYSSVDGRLCSVLDKRAKDKNLLIIPSMCSGVGQVLAEQSNKNSPRSKDPATIKEFSRAKLAAVLRGNKYYYSNIAQKDKLFKDEQLRMIVLGLSLGAETISSNANADWDTYHDNDQLQRTVFEQQSSEQPSDQYLDQLSRLLIQDSYIQEVCSNCRCLKYSEFSSSDTNKPSARLVSSDSTSTISTITSSSLAKEDGNSSDYNDWQPSKRYENWSDVNLTSNNLSGCFGGVDGLYVADINGKMQEMPLEIDTYPINPNYVPTKPMNNLMSVGMVGNNSIENMKAMMNGANNMIRPESAQTMVPIDSESDLSTYLMRNSNSSNNMMNMQQTVVNVQ